MIIMDELNERIQARLHWMLDSIEPHIVNLTPGYRQEVISKTNKLIYDTAEELGVSILHVLLKYVVCYEYSAPEIVQEGEKCTCTSYVKISLKPKPFI